MIDPNEPIDVYHAHPAWGSGDARNLIESPALCMDARSGLCDRRSKALLFGSATHTRLLEPGSCAARVVVKPKGMNLGSAEGKAWKARYAVGKDVLSDTDLAHLIQMEKRMPSEVRAIFDASRKEITVRTTIDGVEVQARPDLWNVEACRFDDLKSIDDLGGGKYAISKTICARRYHIQLAWYRRVVLAETGRHHESRLIFCESAPPYRWRVVDLDPDFVALGDDEVDKAMQEIAARTKSGCWEDRDALFMTAEPPEWALGDITADAEGIHL